jgi:hypothetical protein
MSDRTNSVLERVRAASKRRTVGEIEAMAAELVATHKAPARYLSREEATNVIRGIFRRCGYAIAEHGTKGQDLDLIAVPWTDRAGVPALIVDEVVEVERPTVEQIEYQYKEVGAAVDRQGIWKLLKNEERDV